MGRVLAIDFGDRRFGLAMSDPTRTIARPLEVVEGEKRTLERVGALIASEGVEEIVVGLPRNMDGSLGPKAESVLAFVERLRGGVPEGIAIETWDERLTTVQAERNLAEQGVSRHRRRERVDALAAQILLETWLARSRSR
ncbi:MAG TPA: Holliday junction resolvase RuvX [Planctomycetota bacterium]|nr:Holliday junction resolvase RuvX [Planctomycetota bacterium]